jgi:mono/diheme cytochrome c family protein
MFVRRPAALGVAMVCTIQLAEAQETGNPASGLNYARQACATCHAIQKGDRHSPRHDAPSFEDIANAPGITGISLAATLHSVHENMPNFALPMRERDDIVAYILSLKRER